MQLLVYIYCLLILGVIGFQAALVFGAPWGKFTQGGKYEGALPLPGRFTAGISMIVLTGMALAILSAGGAWPLWTGWAAVALNCVVMVLNWATPAVTERKLWGPITSVLFGLALIVMISR